MKEKFKSETLSHIMDIVKNDSEITESLHLRVRHYLSITFDATWELSSRSQLSNRTKPVRAISAQGHYLGDWPTMKLAAEFLGCERQVIYRSIKFNRPLKWSKKSGNKLRGVKFEYVKEEKLTNK
jgi:hypothetical protein